MKQPKQTGLTIFYSYAHKDEPLREQLERHLHLWSRQGLISEWHDRQIVPGTEWGKEIDAHLETASVIFLLVSSDFLASDYCFNIEMQQALDRHRQGKATVIPIIVRPCNWQDAPFAHLQCLPPDGKAVTSWSNLDEAFLAIIQGLRRIIEEARLRQMPPVPSPTFPLPIPTELALPVREQVPSSPSLSQQATISLRVPATTAPPALMFKFSKRFHSPLVVAGFILLIFIILSGIGLGMYGVVTDNAVRRQATIQASATARVLATGRIWHVQASGISGRLFAVAWLDSQFVAVGDTILTSPNGHTWTDQTPGHSYGLLGVAWSGSRFVAVGSAGTILTSTDGRSWSVQNSGTSETLNDVIWAGSQFVVVGNKSTILFSFDGRSWIAQNSGLPKEDPPYYLQAVAWSGSQFVVVGDEGIILSSPDGHSWTNQMANIADSSGTAIAVVWGHSQFVAVGFDVVYTSPNGYSWIGRNPQGFPPNTLLHAIAWSGSQFVAVGRTDPSSTSPLIYTSPDGLTWTSQNPETPYPLHGVAWSGSQFVAVGWNGAILTSP